MTHLKFLSARWMLACAALILCLALLAREVMSAHNFMVDGDLWFENLMLGIRTPFFLHLFTGVTFFGNAVSIIGMAGLVGIAILFFRIDRAYIAGLAAALLGAAGSGYLMKIIVERARPDGLIPAVTETSFSFPSGHATASIAFYGFAAFILCKLYPKYAKVTMAGAAAIILIVGFSRLYLGVHFPSDVIAGYMVGGLWLIIGVAITKRLQSAANGN